MQYFYINQGSVNNPLRVELVDDARYEYMKNETFSNAIQNADITFSMTNEDGILKISKAPCSLVLTDIGTCDERYIIEYQWKERDTKNKGVFTGKFEIKFNTMEDEDGNVTNDLKEEGTSFPVGNLIVPIYEDLAIMIK